jgi:hypothetical protein
MSLLDNIKSNLFNVPGKKVSDKIIVFESDDWGAIRMKDKQTFERLKKNDIPVDNSLYDSLDSLENKSDLANLFEILIKYKNYNNHNPIFTFNTVMGNPNFEEIKRSDFNEYVLRDLFSSYENYYGEDLIPYWNEAMSKQIIRPQFHAREHLNVQLWMKDLKTNHKETRLAFDNHFYGLKTKTSSTFQNNYLAAYAIDNENEYKVLKSITENGLNLFKQFFGFGSESFIAANYVWPKELELFLKGNGVKYIQSQRGHIAPVIDDSKRKLYRHYFGQKNKSGQYYFMRNVLFEPYLNQKKDWVNFTLSEIQNAFFWKKPAIISTLVLIMSVICQLSTEIHH